MGTQLDNLSNKILSSTCYDTKKINLTNASVVKPAYTASILCKPATDVTVNVLAYTIGVDYETIVKMHSDVSYSS